MQNMNAQGSGLLATTLPASLLVATDLSDTEFLVPFVVAQAKASKANVTLVNAIVPADAVPAEAGVPYTDLAKIERDVRQTLLGVAGDIEKEGVRCDVIVRRGNATEVIREQILAVGAKRLITGTHGRGKLGQLVIGSVASELLRTVQIPMFVVGPHAHNVSLHALPRRIVHPVSLNGDYERSVRFAVGVAESFNADLTLLHILDHSDKQEINPERELLWARNALLALVPTGVKVQTEAVFGKVEEQICQAAKRLHADMIVMGVKDDMPFWPFRESPAYKVIAAAGCPVLTLPHEARPAERVDERAPRYATAMF